MSALRSGRPTTLENFMERRVRPNDSGCWECLGHTVHHGYKVVSVGGKERMAHRYVYEQMVGPIPEGLEIDHLCRNTSCVNPEHLEPVTHDENMRRTRRETCRRGHALNDENTYQYPGRGRACKQCSSDWKRNRRRQQAGGAS